MKRFLTFMLCFCIMFTFSVGASFAAVVSTTYKSEVVKNAVESVCTVDLTKYAKSMEDEIAKEVKELRDFAAEKESLDSEVLKAIDEFRTFLADNTIAKQEAALKDIKADAMIKFDNKVDAYVASKTWTEDEIKLGKKADFEADVKAFTNWFAKRMYHPAFNVINSGHVTGSTELTFETAKKDVDMLTAQAIDDTWFGYIVGLIDKVEDVKFEAKQYYERLERDTTKYSATAIAAARTETYTGIEMLDITDATKFVEPKTIEQEKADKAEADAKALTDAKSAAIFAITAGDYYVGNWSGEAKSYVADIQSKYVVYINAATTIAKVDAYKYEAMRLMDAYQSDAEIKFENDKLNSDLEDLKAELDKIKAESERKEKISNLKEAINSLELKARSEKTSKGYIKVTVKGDISEVEDLAEELGYTVTYRFTRATGKFVKYSNPSGDADIFAERENGIYTNTKGVKGKIYRYKAQVVVYDEDGEIVKISNKNQCKYASRKFGK